MSFELRLRLQPARALAAWAAREERSDHERGRAGEELAARWLRARGERLVGRNLRTPFAEVDLALERGPALVVVEVKTGRAPDASVAAPRWRPADRVTPRQRARLGRAARGLARARGRSRWSVAVLEVRLERAGARIEWVAPDSEDGTIQVVRRRGVIRF